MRVLIAVALLLVAVRAIAVQGSAGPYRVDLRTEPAVVPVGRATVSIRLTDSSGVPVNGATVTVLVQMPGMPMGERQETARAGSTPGSYLAPAVFAMAGTYDAKVVVSGSLGRGETVIGLSTGQDTGGAAGAISPWTVGLALLVLVALALLFRQIRRSGQAFAWRQLLGRQAVFSVLLLGAALIVAVWAVNSLRRPGSMTPLEAQVMDMNAPPPEGTLPVRLARVESKSLGATVTYTGQVVGFVEQDVVPRVGGAIVWMPYYVGSKISKGQVLARLDTSQIDPMVSEKLAGVDAASQGVGVAAMEYRQALDMVTQTQAEVSMAQGELAEAKALLDAARQGRGSAESQVAAAQSDVTAMRADLDGAQADLNYQDQEVRRMKELFDKGAISKDEWQRAQADVQKSRAGVDRAREGVTRAMAQVVAARSELRKTDAEIDAAKRRVQQAEAQVRAKQAAVATSQSAAATAKARIGQSRSGVAQAAAGLRGATTQRGYAELRSEVDGVVTARVISPGTIVAPGQTILKVAQISPIRLQANVPEADLARIRLGAPVKVSRRDADGPPLELRVTSISPSVDPASRTGVVEALYPNSDGRFVPGQYVSMEISTGIEEESLVIPGDAVQTEADRAFVWVAEPEPAGGFTASRREIEIEARSGGSVAVKSGLELGAQVVISPPAGIASGTRLTSETQPREASLGDRTIEITSAGYSPAAIKLVAGKASRLTFIRRASAPCSPEVIFPGLSIRKALPVDVPVAVDIPAQAAGREIDFTCPMNMIKGKAVAE